MNVTKLYKQIYDWASLSVWFQVPGGNRARLPLTTRPLEVAQEEVHVPQDRLAEVEVASVDERRGEGGGVGGSECLFTWGARMGQDLSSVTCEGGEFRMEDKDLVAELGGGLEGSVKVPAGAL